MYPLLEIRLEQNFMMTENYALGLTGWPLTYSLSPAIHNAALHALHLSGEYRLLPVPPLPAGRKAMLHLLEGLRSGELTGLNVTIPHKQAILECLDELTPLAKAVGATNLIYRRGQRLVGDNTDVIGFLADLKKLAPSLPLKRGQLVAKPACALILGAGGAARAAAYGLARLGWGVTIAARHIDQAVKLADDLRASIGLARIDTVHLTAQPDLYPSICDLVDGGSQKDSLDLIVNATSAGMVSHEQETAWPEALLFPQGAFVYDMVYVPRETALVRKARLAGLEAANGAGMLVEQAAAAFEVWTGRAAPRGVMRRAFFENSSPMLKERA
jgi:shikimate dehydrogenase